MSRCAEVEAQLLEKQQHLDHLAHHDQLTGLPNRLVSRASPARTPSRRRAQRHHAGGTVPGSRPLQAHQRLARPRDRRQAAQDGRRARARHVRTEDMVVRMGGDEFIVVLQGIRRTEVISETAYASTEALSAPVVVDGRPLVTTCSIGVSLFPRDGSDMGELLRHSDTAMYQAKDRGRNNFQLFSPIMARKLRERVAIEASLRSGTRSRPARRALPADRRHRHQACDGPRGAAALAASPSRLDLAGSLYRHRRRDRAHRTGRRFRAAAGDRGHQRLATQGGVARAGGGQRLSGAVAALQSARSHRGTDQRARHHARVATARAHRECHVRASRRPRRRLASRFDLATARPRGAYRDRRFRHRLLEPRIISNNGTSTT